MRGDRKGSDGKIKGSMETESGDFVGTSGGHMGGHQKQMPAPAPQQFNSSLPPQNFARNILNGPQTDSRPLKEKSNTLTHVNESVKAHHKRLAGPS